MHTLFSLSILVTLLLPVVSALAILASFRSMGTGIYRLSMAAAWTAPLFAFLSLALFLFMGSDEVRLLGDSIFTLDLNAMTLTVIAFVSLVSLVVHAYSVKYMYDEEGYARYFILLDLMIADIFWLAASGDLVMIALFWHLMGVLLYFLLIHNFRRRAAYRYGFYTLFTHLLADIPLVLAFWLIYHLFQTTDLSEFLQMVRSGSEVTMSLLGFSVPALEPIALLVMISAMIKSTQFPFHIWLPFTLEGPNPVSALMHAGIVNAGAFLANRFAPLFLHGDAALHLALVVGLATAIVGSALMLIQNDIKKALAYSTVGQMGYMMLEVGMGAFALAIYHMMVHGIFKASLFLGSGGIIHEARNEPNISDETVFSFYFREPHGRMPGLWDYLLFVLAIPALVTWLLLSPLAAENGLQAVGIFYFFAWATGAQLIYSLYHDTPAKWGRAIALATIGFALALLFYVAMEHFFGGFFYPDATLLHGLLAAAAWPEAVFWMLTGVTLLLFVAAWLLLYRKLHDHRPILASLGSAYDELYRLFSREFYLLDFAESFAERLVRLSRRINERMRY